MISHGNISELVMQGETAARLSVDGIFGPNRECFFRPPPPSSHEITNPSTEGWLTLSNPHYATAMLALAWAAKKTSFLPWGGIVMCLRDFCRSTDSRLSSVDVVVDNVTLAGNATDFFRRRSFTTSLH